MRRSGLQWPLERMSGNSTRRTNFSGTGTIASQETSEIQRKSPLCACPLAFWSGGVGSNPSLCSWSNPNTLVLWPGLNFSFKMYSAYSSENHTSLCDSSWNTTAKKPGSTVPLEAPLSSSRLTPVFSFKCFSPVPQAVPTLTWSGGTEKVSPPSICMPICFWWLCSSSCTTSRENAPWEGTGCGVTVETASTQGMELFCQQHGEFSCHRQASGVHHTLCCWS